MCPLKFLFLLVVIVGIQGKNITERVVAGTRSNHITYRLYNSNVRGVIYTSEDEHIDELVDGVPNVVLIHGEGGSHRDDFSTILRLYFYDYHNVNLFSMDWEQLAEDNANIFDNMKSAAHDLVQFLLHLRNNINEHTNHENGVHLVGFGIGAHLAGKAGALLRINWPIARITGLDPTGGEMFGRYSCHLSERDALYVEIIHTDGPVSNSNPRELTPIEEVEDQTTSTASTISFPRPTGPIPTPLPESTTEGIVETTPLPEATTEGIVESTPLPEATTEGIVETTPLPEATTESIVETTPHPEATTEGIVETTPHPETTTDSTTSQPPTYIGIGRRIGDVDFFVNGGNDQPGCNDNRCSHTRSWQLYALSLKYNHLLGFRCTNMDQMINNECRGLAVLMGGAELVKVPILPGIYRMDSHVITENIIHTE